MDHGAPYASHTKLLGHPIHPMLVVFPISLITFGAIMDIVGFIAGTDRWGDFAFWLFLGGLLFGIPTFLTGVNDWWGLPRGTRAKVIGAIHGLTNVVALILTGWSVALRFGDDNDATLSAALLTWLGVALLMVGGWFGGELVYRLGVGVERSGLVTALPEMKVVTFARRMDEPMVELPAARVTPAAAPSETSMVETTTPEDPAPSSETRPLSSVRTTEGTGVFELPVTVLDDAVVPEQNESDERPDRERI